MKPETTSITLSEPSLKILKWWSVHLLWASPGEVADWALQLDREQSSTAFRALKPLVQQRLVEYVPRGHYRITPAGRAFIHEHYPEKSP